MKKHTFMFLFLSVWTRSDTNLASQSFVKHVDDEFYQTEAMMFSVRHFSSRCTAAQGVDVSIVSLQKRKIYRSEKSHNLIGIIALPPSRPIQIEGLIWFGSLSPGNSRSRWISSHHNKVDPWSVNTFEVPITSYSSNKTDISVHDVPNPPCLHAWFSWQQNLDQLLESKNITKCLRWTSCKNIHWWPWSCAHSIFCLLVWQQHLSIVVSKKTWACNGRALTSCIS